MLAVPGAPMDFYVMASTPPRERSLPNPTSKIPAPPPSMGGLSGYVLPDLTPM